MKHRWNETCLCNERLHLRDQTPFSSSFLPNQRNRRPRKITLQIQPPTQLLQLFLQFRFAILSSRSFLLIFQPITDAFQARSTISTCGSDGSVHAEWPSGQTKFDMHDVKVLLERTLKRPLPRIREQAHSIYARNDQPIARLRNIHQLTQRNGVCLLQADDLAVGEPTSCR